MKTYIRNILVYVSTTKKKNWKPLKGEVKNNIPDWNKIMYQYHTLHTSKYIQSN
jgi:hypothetical protein